MNIPPKPIGLCEQADFCTGEQHWRRHPERRFWCQLCWSFNVSAWVWYRVTSQTLITLLNAYEAQLQEKRISIET